MKNSRARGKRGELELAKYLREEFGWTSARRSAQYCGKAGAADIFVEEMPHLHIECKYVEKLNIQDAIDQAKADAKDGTVPIVFHRKNRGKWLLTFELTHHNWNLLIKS